MNFALPSKRIYPIGDKNHLANAIAVICKNGTSPKLSKGEKREIYDNIMKAIKEYGVYFPNPDYLRKQCLNPKSGESFKQTFVFR